MSSASPHPAPEVELVRAARQLRAELARRLAPLGLHPGQEQLLGELWEDDGRTLAELADALAIEPPTVTRMARRLEAAGFVVRHPHPDDGRSVQVWLTDDGDAVRTDVQRAVRSVRRRLRSGISERQEAQLVALLGQVADNLDS